MITVKKRVASGDDDDFLNSFENMRLVQDIVIKIEKDDRPPRRAAAIEAEKKIDALIKKEAVSDKVALLEDEDEEDYEEEDAFEFNPIIQVFKILLI